MPPVKQKKGLWIFEFNNIIHWKTVKKEWLIIAKALVKQDLVFTWAYLLQSKHDWILY